MGNCFRRCIGDNGDLDYDNGAVVYNPRSGYHGYGGHDYGGYRPAPVTPPVVVVGFTAFARDLTEFETTNEVPRELKRYVLASEATQRIWYKKLLAAWKRANPAPATAEAVAVLLVQTLQGSFDVQGLLRFYHLPLPTVLDLQPVQVPAGQLEKRKSESQEPAGKPAGKQLVPASEPEIREPEAQEPASKQKKRRKAHAGKQKKKLEAHAPAGKQKKNCDSHAPHGKPEKRKRGVRGPACKPDWETPVDGRTWLVTPEDADKIQYEIHTLPVKWKENVGDGDGITVFVDVHKNAREIKILPKEIQDAAVNRRDALAQKNYEIANAWQKQIEAGKYKVYHGKKGEAWCLARMYDIRLRGVDAPEIRQPYGEEARDLLRRLVNGQRLVIHVYNTDCFEREVGDVYCNGMFIQEVLLKNGSVWHFDRFDKRETFAKWETAAKEACLGLWADTNPEKPWDYRKKCRKMDPNWGSFRRKGA